ncbi:MAG: MTH938/NDUFAF3 family protein [Candidatus Devosia phytovorans]|uniref:MTH938/NDUFAF3 family protein n=1 Tax=Candidatus Devosia phytovorans TaxID=3121372 RepID=A0AAJ6B2D9_9HYPH|nr:MTH938/NDUFAF3 family protein [Devosia sp.]WEK06324.1 MAG: MTH938/NDUFAF3 family protein [Devosia sp.]
MTEAPRFSTQTGIDAYGNGGFRFAGMSHKGGLLCLPSGMMAWPVTTPAEITLETLAPIFAVADQIDVLMIGLGPDIAAFPKDLREALRERKIIVEAINTGSAIRTYNVLLAEERAVAAALIAVDKVR